MAPERLSNTSVFRIGRSQGGRPARSPPPPKAPNTKAGAVPGAGADVIVRRASFGQVKLPSLLALNADDRAISNFLVCLPVQGHPDRKITRPVVSNDSNTADGFTARPLSNRLQALLSESPVAYPDGFEFHHAVVPRALSARGEHY